MPMQYGAPNQVYQPGQLPTQPNIPQRGTIGGSLGLGTISPMLGLINYLRPEKTSGIRDFFKGSPQFTEQLPTVTPEVQQALMQLLQQGMGGLNKFDFGPIEEQARMQFAQQTIPSIAERFTALGGQGSGAFKQSLGQAGAGLEQQLAAMKQNYNLQREPLFQNLIRMGLMPQFENIIHPRQPGFLETGGSALLGGLGQALGMYATGGMGSIPRPF